MSILPPVLVGIIFFFVIIGVFGLWFAVDGLALSVLICLYIFLKRPEQEQT
jgi:hypothetical protein